MTTQKRPSTIDDALKILDEALVKQQMPDLTPLLGDELNAVKTKIQDTFSETGRAELNDLKEGFALAKEFGADLGNKIMNSDLVGEFGRDLTRDLNKKIQENPWPIIGGIAVGAAAFGFLLGQRSANTQRSSGK